MKVNKPKLVRGNTGPVQVNQHAPLFNDRRTKRNRDRSTQKRNAIQDGKN